MTASQMPPKVVLDAETDQALAFARDHRLSHGSLATILAEGIADQVREQFGPGNGRIVMAVAQAINGVEKAMREEYAMPMSPGQLIVIAALAAEQLEREARP
jgi:hypothetical protein